jgi:GTP-binding protein HflX
MFERPNSGEYAILVHIEFAHENSQGSLTEFNDLVCSAGATPVETITGKRYSPDPRYFIGRGKVEEIQKIIEYHNAEIVLFNHSLTPAQERNLEQEFKCRVLDRTGIILDIFAQRARSFEGKLQVELAQLKHLSTRLVRGWTHLERQKGGIGLRGPGEKQLETDRRLLSGRIKQINKRLHKVDKQRQQGRKARKRAQLPSVSLVGYTNAGKSTLFNKVTESSVYAADKLFATLDPTLRKLDLEQKKSIILADTVGFIQDLPHDLIAAFHSTLDETIQADLLLHIVDSRDSERQLRIDQVNEVLHEIGAQHVPQLLIYNKVDDLADCDAHVEYNKSGKISKVWLSAITGEGIDLLLTALSERLCNDIEQHFIHIPVTDSQVRAKFYELGTVKHENFTDDGNSILDIKIATRHFAYICKNHNVEIINNKDFINWSKKNGLE